MEDLILRRRKMIQLTLTGNNKAIIIKENSVSDLEGELGSLRKVIKLDDFDLFVDLADKDIDIKKEIENASSKT